MQVEDKKTISPVLALTIIDGQSLENGKLSKDTRLLLAVRNPDTNSTHPNVISVPTQRIPHLTSNELIKSTKKEYHDKSSSTTIFASQINRDDSIPGHDSLIFAVESLLSRKLGLSEFLEYEKIRYSVLLRALVTGTVKHPNHSEKTLMLNAVVIIHSGAALFPDSTASYSYIQWTNVQTFIKTASEKDPLYFNPILSPIDYCIHGLCIMSTYNIVAHSLGIDFYPYAIYNK